MMTLEYSKNVCKMQVSVIPHVLVFHFYNVLVNWEGRFHFNRSKNAEVLSIRLVCENYRSVME